MKFILLTHTVGTSVTKHYVNIDKIHKVSLHGKVTWINLGDPDYDFTVDQTFEEIIQLITEVKNEQQ